VETYARQEQEPQRRARMGMACDATTGSDRRATPSTSPAPPQSVRVISHIVASVPLHRPIDVDHDKKATDLFVTFTITHDRVITSHHRSSQVATAPPHRSSLPAPLPSRPAFCPLVLIGNLSKPNPTEAILRALLAFHLPPPSSSSIVGWLAWGRSIGSSRRRRRGG
jgi:hypothetical protein